jgi:hypothetical protein
LRHLPGLALRTLEALPIRYALVPRKGDQTA